MISTAARVYGVLFVLVGILGFVPGLAQPSDAPGTVLLLGIFPVNALHDIVHLLIGILGFLVAGSVSNARTYFRALAIVYGLLAVLGLIPATNTVFGLVPIGGPDVALHAAAAIAAAYFGWSSAKVGQSIS